MKLKLAEMILALAEAEERNGNRELSMVSQE